MSLFLVAALLFLYCTAGVAFHQKSQAAAAAQQPAPIDCACRNALWDYALDLSTYPSDHPNISRAVH